MGHLRPTCIQTQAVQSLLYVAHYYTYSSIVSSSGIHLFCVTLLPAARIAPPERRPVCWGQRTLHGTAICSIWRWHELLRLSDFAEVLEYVDGLFTTIARKIDAKQFSSVVFPRSVRGSYVL